MATTTAATDNSTGMVLSDYFAKKTAEKDKALYTEKSDNSSLDKNDFLNLLVTQLRYQDPMNPSDNQQMAAQLAQYSSLEQTQNMAKSLDNMTGSLKDMVKEQQDSAWSMSSSSATNMMGKTVRLKQSDVSFAGTAVKMKVSATSGSELVVLDSEDKVVRTMALDGYNNDGTRILNSDGEGVATWDGTTDRGEKAAIGTYKLAVRQAGTTTASGSVFTDAVVAGIEFDPAGPKIVADGKSYSMSDLMAVAAATL